MGREHLGNGYFPFPLSLIPNEIPIPEDVVRQRQLPFRANGRFKDVIFIDNMAQGLEICHRVF